MHYNSPGQEISNGCFCSHLVQILFFNPRLIFVSVCRLGTSESNSVREPEVRTMLSLEALRHHHEDLHHEATRLAGGLNDLAQRAAVYHHLYEHSGGNHAFPLIAAHGTLGARGYVRLGIKLGWFCPPAGLPAPNRRRLGRKKRAPFP